jgi:hypothetical protein
MHSMKHQDTLVIGGVDSHADTHHAAALDQRGVSTRHEGLSHHDAWIPSAAGLVVRLR